MAIKITMLFGVTTEAVDPSVSSPHSGGWSESLWTAGTTPLTTTQINTLLTARARLLPKQASIVGLRQGIFTLAENKFLPGQSNAQKVNYPGDATLTCNMPQDSLELTGYSNSSINTNRFRVGCLPDEMITKGEYAPTSSYFLRVNGYCALLAAGGAAYFFPGRVLDNPTRKVMSIIPAGGGTATVILSSSLGGTINEQYLRFNRTKDDDGVAIQGSFLIVGFASPATYTISGWTGQTVTNPSGLARIDQASLFQFRNVVPSRAVVKKIGRPSQGYRGRASKRVRA